jgi:hypothetical protein
MAFLDYRKLWTRKSYHADTYLKLVDKNARIIEFFCGVYRFQLILRHQKHFLHANTIST